MKKSSNLKSILFLSLAVLLIISVLNVTSALGAPVDDRGYLIDDTDTGSNVAGSGSGVVVSTDTNFLGLFSFNLTEKWNLWKLGPDADKDKVSELMKYYILFLMIIICYSAFSALKFPKGGPLQLILAIITGFMATFLISTRELLTLAQSYGALGLAITTFLPLLVLLGLTIVVATKSNPAGLFISKVLWLGYALFLFFRTGLLWIASRTLYVTEVPNQIGNYTLGGKMSSLIAPFFGTTRTMVNGNMTTVLSQSAEKDLINMLVHYDPTTMFVLGVLALAIIYFMVIKSDWLYEYLDHMKRDSEVSAAKSVIKGSKDYDKLKNDALKDMSSDKT